MIRIWKPGCSPAAQRCRGEFPKIEELQCRRHDTSQLYVELPFSQSPSAADWTVVNDTVRRRVRRLVVNSLDQSHLLSGLTVIT